MWLTTSMPSSDYNIWSFELKLDKKILDKVEKQFLLLKCGFYQKSVGNFSYLDYSDF